MAGLKKLEILAFKDRNFSESTGHSFSMMVNPSNYNESKSIRYDRGNCPHGKGAPAFNSYQGGRIKIEFLLDNTGAFIRWMEYQGERPSLSETIKNLEETVYAYIDDKHQPPFLKVAWGELNFTGRLVNMVCNYQMFNSEGAAIRAKVTLDLLRYVSAEKQGRQNNENSPDLSHRVTVKDGDTLPVLCKRIYEDEAYCMEVARINGLTGFRHLEPGMQLLFPPLSNE